MLSDLAEVTGRSSTVLAGTGDRTSNVFLDVNVDRLGAAVSTVVVVVVEEVE